MANFITMYKSEDDARNNINALAVPDPAYKSAKQTASTLVNSGRSSHNGKVYAQRVGDRDFSKLDLTWSYLTATQWSNVLGKILNGDESFYVWIKYFDMQKNDWSIREFYPSDRTATPFTVDSTTKKVLSWIDCSVSFVDTGEDEINV